MSEDEGKVPPTNGPFGPRPASIAEAEVVYVHMEPWAAWEKEGESGEGGGDTGNAGGFELSWGIKGIGFGVFSFVKENDGSYTVDTESMDVEWVRKVLNAFLDTCAVRPE